MRKYDTIVEAAKNHDLWALDCLYHAEKDLSFDRPKTNLELTPAGFLARQGEWEAVNLLFENYRVDPAGILFGAVLGGAYPQIKIFLATDRLADYPLLDEICSKLNREEINVLVIKALACLDQQADVDEILSQVSVEQQRQLGYLEAAIVGAAYAGNQKRVSHLMSVITKEAGSFDTVRLWLPLIDKLDEALLKAAAEGGHRTLIEHAFERLSQKYARFFVKDVEKYLYHDTWKVISALLKNGHIDLLDSYFKPLLDQADKWTSTNASIQLYKNQGKGKKYVDEILALIRCAKQVDQSELIQRYINRLMPKDTEYNRLIHKQIMANFTNQKHPPFCFETPVNYLRRTYQLSLGHAKQLSSIPHLVDKICDETITDHEKIMVARYLTAPELVEPISELIRHHQPRKTFLMALDTYVKNYKASYIPHYNHIERVKSLLEYITYATSDEEFGQLIQQQRKLLNKESCDVCIGNKESKFNQPVKNTLEKDEFTMAVQDCFEAIQDFSIYFPPVGAGGSAVCEETESSSKLDNLSDAYRV